MKITLRHDGSGNFTGSSVQNGGSTETDAAVQFMLSSVAEGIGQALLFQAGLRGIPVGKCIVSVSGDSAPEGIHKNGLDVTIETSGSQDTMEELVRGALSHCFPEGSAACPVRHTVIATSKEK